MARRLETGSAEPPALGGGSVVKKLSTTSMVNQNVCSMRITPSPAVLELNARSTGRSSARYRHRTMVTASQHRRNTESWWMRQRTRGTVPPWPLSGAQNSRSEKLRSTFRRAAEVVRLVRPSCLDAVTSSPDGAPGFCPAAARLTISWYVSFPPGAGAFMAGN